MWMRSGKRLVSRMMTNDGCGDDGGKGGKGGGKGRLGVRRMRWKIERRRREKKDMLLFNYFIQISKAAPALSGRSVFEFYIYLIHIHIVSLPDILYVWWVGGGGVGGGGGREIRREMPMYVLHVIQNRNLAVDNEVKTPDQVVEKSDRFEDT